MEKTKFCPSNEWLAAQKALMKAIGFSEDDLDANRGGYMSKKQRAKMSLNRAAWLNNITVIILFTAGLFVYVVVAGIVSGWQFGTSLMGFGVLSVIVGVAALYMGIMRSRLNADLHKGDVFSVEGRIALHVERNKEHDVVAYHARLQGQHFKISRAVFGAFTDDEPYAIYYAPNSKTLLSAEWLHKRES